MNIPVLPSEQDDIVNSLNYEGIAVIELCSIPETPYVLYMQLQHQGNIRNGAILSIFFTRIRSTEGSSADCSLFILSLHALALHLAVKILLQIFLYEDLSTLTLHTSVGCISLQNASRTALCYATNTIMNCFILNFYSELKRHNVSHYIYYLATDNIHRVRKTITPC